MAQNSDIGEARPRTVLIARFSALGDVAMTIPVVYSVCRCHPHTRFVFVTRPSMTALFVDPPANFTAVGIDLKNDYKGVRGIYRLVARLVDEYRPDIFVDLHNVLRTRLMGAFMRLKGISGVRLYKARAKRRALTRTHNKVMLPLTSQRARYREAFFKADLPMTDRFAGLFGGHAKAPVERFATITTPPEPGEVWVGIAPFAAHAGKVYPTDRMELVLAALQADAGRRRLRVFLFGGGATEQSVLEAWADKYPCATSLAGKRYGFGAELALINHLDVMLTMDSANMHMAAIAGTPTVSVWGATHPYCGFKGWRQTDDDTVQLPLACRPCSIFGDRPCHRGDLLCLGGIRPEMILEKIYRYFPKKS